MKKYNKPKITSVQLKPEQALFSVCQVGAGSNGYFFSNICMAGPTLGMDLSCKTKVRGVGLTGTVLTSNEESENAPS
ncbi:MAG: hypothetical protein PHQ52_06240 [Candidatus Omnitrophica bacterium]|nr:hypothetical protein [Candidatus Omnitrophota bacterium]